MLLVREFVILMLTSISLALEDCPRDDCYRPPPLPTVKDGKIKMTVFYDNDGLHDTDQWDTKMVLKACEALDKFGDEFEVIFKIGAMTWKDDSTEELHCRADCYADRLEACAKMFVKDFPKFVCCNNRNRNVFDCAQDQQVPKYVMDDCFNNKKSDYILLDNSKKRRDFKIPDCHLPEFAFNDIVDRCIKIADFGKLKEVLCAIYKEAEMNVPACN